MAKRLKSDKPALIEIKDWAAADVIIRRIYQYQCVIDEASQKATKNINEIKDSLTRSVNFEQEKIRQLTISLEAFALAHKADFGKDRSRKLNFGLLGWRKSTSVVIKKTTLEKIKAGFAKAKAAMCIITKETVSKEALAKLTDEDLASVGARREVKDDFFVEPDLPEAVDYCE